MDEKLSTRVGYLANIGWRVQSQTDTTVALETRQPINWWIFAVLLFFFFGIPALIYLLFWQLTSKMDLFISVQGDELAESGDTWYTESLEDDYELAQTKAREIKERGFWPVMWPSVLATVLMLAAWIVILWLVFKLT